MDQAVYAEVVGVLKEDGDGIEINNNIAGDNNDGQIDIKKPNGRTRHHRNRRRNRDKENEREPRPKKEKPVKCIQDISQKNAVMMLNELFSADKAPIYKVLSQEGPANNPHFVMTCTVEGRTFQGSGKSKKDAKLSCSKEAVEQLFPDQQFKLEEEQASRANSKPVVVTSSVETLLEMEGKNPISILNEMHPGVQYHLISSQGPSHSPEYIMEASLPHHLVTGTGKSKKDAKLNASKALLVQIHQVELNPKTSEIVCSKGAGTAKADLHNEARFSHTFADQVAALVTDKFNEIFGMTSHSKRKVLAGFVVTRDKKSEVVCVSTGTKCINGENLSLTGASINDSHAEILARRGLMYWLYNQLELACQHDPESIFVKASGGGFDLKEGIYLDMYINTAPCGDSRLFAMHEEAVEGQNLLTGPTGKLGENNRGKLRSKVESGMGTVPLQESESAIQTWDGIAGGERLLTMSCSDKILRWNILGCQGSLLCHWIKPIYMRSITIGSRFHPGHMSRAFFERCPTELDRRTNKDEFLVNKPQLLATTSPEARAVWKTSESCVLWINGEGPEILNGVNGKVLQTGVESKICKMSLMKKFKNLNCNNEAVPRYGTDKETLANLSYMKLKFAAEKYQTRKEEMVSALKLNGSGKWMKKPVEIDLFYSR